MAKRPEALVTWNDPPGRLSRVDPRYAPGAFHRIKAGYLARFLARTNPFHPRVLVAGAGRITRRRPNTCLRTAWTSPAGWTSIPGKWARPWPAALSAICPRRPGRNPVSCCRTSPAGGRRNTCRPSWKGGDSSLAGPTCRRPEAGGCRPPARAAMTDSPPTRCRSDSRPPAHWRSESGCGRSAPRDPARRPSPRAGVPRPQKNRPLPSPYGEAARISVRFPALRPQPTGSTVRPRVSFMTSAMAR